MMGWEEIKQAQEEHRKAGGPGVAHIYDLVLVFFAEMNGRGIVFKADNPAKFKPVRMVDGEWKLVDAATELGCFEYVRKAHEREGRSE